MKKRKSEQRPGQFREGTTVEHFNAIVPVGTPVRFQPWRGCPDDKLFDSKTRSEAWTVGDHASVLIEGKTGSVCVSFLEVIR